MNGTQQPPGNPQPQTPMQAQPQNHYAPAPMQPHSQSPMQPQSPSQPHPMQPHPQKNSFGIAAIVLAIIGIAFFSVLSWAFDEKLWQNELLVYPLSCVFFLAGFIICVVSLQRKTHNKTLAIMALVLNVLGIPIAMAVYSVLSLLFSHNR